MLVLAVLKEAKELKCCFTGYRPGKFPFPLIEGAAEYEKLKIEILDQLLDLCGEGYTTFYTGCAMGFDLIAAEQLLHLRDRYKSTGFELVCAVPFAEQALKYPKNWRERYQNVLKKADRVALLSDLYFKGCYQLRNRWMVDRSDLVLTWFDGRSGGTKNTLLYAEKCKKKIVNLYPSSAEETMYSLFPAET